MKEIDYQFIINSLLKDPNYTIENIAEAVNVTPATVRAWKNGRATPRRASQFILESLYESGPTSPCCQTKSCHEKDIFLTICLFPHHHIAVGARVTLERDHKNHHDDEAIRVHAEEPTNNFGLTIPVDAIREEQAHDFGHMYVANSVNTVIRGTYSAGRLYDKIEDGMMAKVLFVGQDFAIARLLK